MLNDLFGCMHAEIALRQSLQKITQTAAKLRRQQTNARNLFVVSRQMKAIVVHAAIQIIGGGT